MYTHTFVHVFYIYNIATCINYLTYIFMHTGKTINIFFQNYFGDKKYYTNTYQTSNTVPSNKKLFYFPILWNLTNDLKVF